MAIGIAALAVFVILWWPVLTGQRSLLTGDVLYAFLPWSAEPGAHAPSNVIASDPMVVMLPWQEFVAKEFAKGELPLWNPSVESGAPILANDQAAAFSPFTWLAMLFPAAVGLSLAMLAKLLVAGLGMAFYLRALKAGSAAAALAGIAFACSSFMVDWLAWPLTNVAAFMPWMFGFAEVYVAKRRLWALPGLALAVCFQFLGGHAETSLHMDLALGFYAGVRWIFSGHRLQTLAGLGGAVAVGTLLAGIQLVPFVDLLRQAQLITARSTLGKGFLHLDLVDISTWIFPNAAGNPGIDHRGGHLPNFPESTGFAGVAALVLSPIGAWWAWSRERSVAIALVGLSAIAAGLIYGPLAPIAGRLPGLAVAYNVRSIVVLCFCVAALGGLGLDGLMRSTATLPVNLPARGMLWVGALGLAGVVAVGLLVWTLGARVDGLLPQGHTYIGFWIVSGLLALGSAIAFVLGGLAGGRRAWAATGLCALALAEGALFAGTFYPLQPLSAVPPPSPAAAWLAAHADGRQIAGLGTTLLPETALLYGLSDVRGYEILTDPRERVYWSAADPRYDDTYVWMELNQPDAAWLAAAGVAYVIMPAGQSIPGTTMVYTEPGVAIAEVPNPRPFAYAATSVESARTAGEAATVLANDPLGAVVVEGCCPQAGPADVQVTSRSATSVELRVNASAAATIVIDQSYQSGWVATVDGQPATILPANVLFQSVAVPQGSHVVSLQYRPQSITVGAGASLAGAFGLLLLVVLAVRFRGKPQSS
jgi:hypothetical protein